MTLPATFKRAPSTEGHAHGAQAAITASEAGERFGSGDTVIQGNRHPSPLVSGPLVDIIGLAQQVVTKRGATAKKLDRSNKVIGVVCSGDVAVYRDDVKAAIQRGIEQRPDAVWVCTEPKSDRMTHDLMLSLGIEPVVLPMLSYWKGDCNQWGRPFDERRTMRDTEILLLCDELIVFHKRAGHSPWREKKKWGEANGIYKHLWIVELGPDKGKKK